MATAPSEGYEEPMSAISTTNPATGEVLKSFEPMTTEQVAERIGRAHAGFPVLRAAPFDQRGAWLRAAADILDAEVETIATMMTTEMGKTLASARAEVAKCAKACRFYAEHAERFLADEPADAAAVGAVRAYATYQPLGPVLAVMPWNFPLWQAMRFAAPALMAGNLGPAQARLERATDRAVHGGAVPSGRLPRRLVPDPADRLGRGRGGADRRPGAGGHPDRQRGRPGGRWRRSRAVSSRRRCWSSAAATRTS